jgi:hypothetical protein
MCAHKQRMLTCIVRCQPVALLLLPWSLCSCSCATPNLLLLWLLCMLGAAWLLLQVPPEDAGGPRDLHKRHVRQRQAHAAVLLVSTQSATLPAVQHLRYTCSSGHSTSLTC